MDTKQDSTLTAHHWIWTVLYGPRWQSIAIRAIVEVCQSGALDEFPESSVKYRRIMQQNNVVFVAYYNQQDDKTISVSNFTITSSTNTTVDDKIINLARVGQIRNPRKYSNGEIIADVKIGQLIMHDIISMDYYVNPSTYTSGASSRFLLTCFAAYIDSEDSAPVTKTAGMTCRILYKIDNRLVCITGGNYSDPDGAILSVIIGRSTSVHSSCVLAKGKMIWVRGITTCRLAGQLEKKTVQPENYNSVPFMVDNTAMVCSFPRRVVDISKITTGSRHLCSIVMKYPGMICGCEISLTSLHQGHVFIDSNTAPMLDFLTLHDCLSVSLACKRWITYVWKGKTLNRAREHLSKYFSGEHTGFDVESWLFVGESKQSIGILKSLDPEEKARSAAYVITGLKLWSSGKIARWVNLTTSRFDKLNLWDMGLCSLWGFTHEEILQIEWCNATYDNRKGSYYLHESLVEARNKFPWPTEKTLITKGTARCYKYLPKFVKERLIIQYEDENITYLYPLPVKEGSVKRRRVDE